ncbi:spore germination protein PB [Mesobacillus persicus]|uniref:Spore germination protein PB n=1 Tax=Mesobacillus persicus TaxID=930146 RepID=A0A1H8E1F1_9BACI|nr:spore germination protein GerPB [Mesobacillus persicus]SEN13409.1 spore germination protein PB [Mesobacillus persicus]
MANFYIQQSININLLRVDAVSNSSVLQIGSSGIIKPASYLYNTGGYTAPAPEPGEPNGGDDPPIAPVVPLQSPTAS